MPAMPSTKGRNRLIALNLKRCALDDAAEKGRDRPREIGAEAQGSEQLRKDSGQDDEAQRSQVAAAHAGHPGDGGGQCDHHQRSEKVPAERESDEVCAHGFFKGLPCEKASHGKVQNGENRAPNNRHQELGQHDVGAGDGQGQKVRDGVVCVLPTKDPAEKEAEADQPADGNDRLVLDQVAERGLLHHHGRVHAGRAKTRPMRSGNTTATSTETRSMRERRTLKAST